MEDNQGKKVFKETWIGSLKSELISKGRNNLLLTITVKSKSFKNT